MINDDSRYIIPVSNFTHPFLAFVVGLLFYFRGCLKNKTKLEKSCADERKKMDNAEGKRL